MDYNNKGPQTEFNGRKYSAEIEFYLEGDETEEQIEELITEALACDGLNNPSVYMVRAHDAWSYTDWSAQTDDGRRSGLRRIERAPRSPAAPTPPAPTVSASQSEMR